MTTMMMTSKIEADVGNDDVDGGINAEIAERILQPSPSSCRIGIAGRHTTMPYHTVPYHTMPHHATVVFPYCGIAMPCFCHTMVYQFMSYHIPHPHQSIPYQGNMHWHRTVCVVTLPSNTTLEV